MNKKYMVFDVESVGLHGEGFAVGFVVVDETGTELSGGTISCNSDKAKGTSSDRKWISENVPKSLPGMLKYTPKEVRDSFWKQWMDWKSKGAILIADCAWPVEARFLAACIDDNPNERNWDGPYPLHDLASVLLAKGKDPTGTFERLDSELPKHDPTCDARQSARILIELLKQP